MPTSASSPSITPFVCTTSHTRTTRAIRRHTHSGESKKAYQCLRPRYGPVASLAVRVLFAALRGRYLANIRGPRRGGGRADEEWGPLWPPAGGEDFSVTETGHGRPQGPPPHILSTPAP